MNSKVIREALVQLRTKALVSGEQHLLELVADAELSLRKFEAATQQGGERMYSRDEALLVAGAAVAGAERGTPLDGARRALKLLA